MIIQGERKATRQHRHSGLFASPVQEEIEHRVEIDYKMVTFSLGGKDYGVDIMKVAQIAKFEQYTRVPNTQQYVTGVYNLRGDIISLIDLRRMFNLPVPVRAAEEPEEGLILRLETGLVGIIVDTIDQVVGISSRTIQPPHPIYADVNMRSISGVAERDGRLYIILDVERLFGDAPEELEPVPEIRSFRTVETAELIAETLRTLGGFVMTDLNRRWVEERLRTWGETRDSEAAITTEEEVETFLSTFYAPYSGRLWDTDCLDGLRSLLSSDLTGNIHVWNPGCGAGHESFSIACLLRTAYPDARIKIWAGDSDLLNVSTAPNLTLDGPAVPSLYEPYVVQNDASCSFRNDIRQMVLFEFSDVRHTGTIPPCDIIVIRDLLSFLPERDQRRVIALIEEQADESTLVVTGTNEDLAAMSGFEEVAHGTVRAFRLP